MKKVSRKTGIGRDVYDRQAILCKAFANPTRLHLLDLLSRGEVGASELQERLGVSKANLSQHLSLLRSAGVVHTRREGKRLLAELPFPEVAQACQDIRNILKRQDRRQRTA